MVDELIRKREDILQYYAIPGKMTDANRYLSVIQTLPKDITSLVKNIQGLLIHEFGAKDLYQVDLSPVQLEQAHLRKFNQMLDHIFQMNNLPLTTIRAPKDRLNGVCYHFAKFLVSILRAHAIPARMRYGFAGYLNPGFYEEHVLCEYWNREKQKWMLVDTQFDDLWKKHKNLTLDIFDVPRTEFLVAGVAWQKCRNHEIDPATVGIFRGNLRGLWYVAGGVAKDLASLNKMELLPWDAWGNIPRPTDTMQDKKKLKKFDDIANFSESPDEHFNELRALYDDPTQKFSVPDRVFNAMHGHLEYIDE